MKFDVKFNGLSEIDKIFLNMPRSSQRKIYSYALRKGAYPVKVSATNNIKSVSSPFTGLLSRQSSVAIYNLKKKRGYYRVSVQIKRKLVNVKKVVNGSPVRVGLYASVLEYGKKNQAPRPWLRKALRERKGDVFSSINSEFNKRLIDAIKDARK